jgi:SAM-dependent methyltransferase
MQIEVKVIEKIGLNVGCGHEPEPGWVNVDLRALPGSVDIQAHIIWMPFGDRQFQWIKADSVLEHLRDPRPAIGELARLIQVDGVVEIRVPALGTNAAGLDPTHQYLADLKHWVELMDEQFHELCVSCVGVRWRYHKLLVLIQYFLIRVFSMHEFGQCWVIRAKKPRTEFKPIIPKRWWLD